MSISVGIVGTGSFGHRFVDLFNNHPDVSRVALCDLDADRLAEAAREFEIAETYTSLDDICQSDLDALAIITQPWLHGPQAIQVMESGKHVYSAVPPAGAFGNNTEEVLELCDRLVDTVERTGQIYMLGETTFFRKETIYCREKAATGAFGEFVYGESEYFHDLSFGVYELVRNRWRDEFGPDKTGMTPMYYPTHSISALVSVMGAHMTEVSCQGYRYPDDDWFRDDTIYGCPFSNQVALFRMSNGASARVCEFRRLGRPEREGLRSIYGTEACCEIDANGAKWITKEGCDPVDLEDVREPLPPEIRDLPDDHGGSHRYLVHEFVDSCNHSRQPRINIWEALRYFVPGIIAHQSAMRGGELLKIPDWDDSPQ